MVDRNRIATMPITLHGLDVDLNPEPQYSTSNAVHVLNVAVQPGESVVFDRAFGGALAKKVSLSADGQVGVAGPCIYYGSLVTTVLGAGVVNVRDAVAAGAGDIVDILPSASAVGYKSSHPFGVYCPFGVYADFASTGTVTFFYQQV